MDVLDSVGDGDGGPDSGGEERGEEGDAGAGGVIELAFAAGLPAVTRFFRGLTNLSEHTSPRCVQRTQGRLPQHLTLCT